MCFLHSFQTPPPLKKLYLKCSKSLVSRFWHSSCIRLFVLPAQYTWRRVQPCWCFSCTRSTRFPRRAWRACQLSEEGATNMRSASHRSGDGVRRTKWARRARGIYRFCHRFLFRSWGLHHRKPNFKNRECIMFVCNKSITWASVRNTHASARASKGTYSLQ